MFPNISASAVSSSVPVTNSVAAAYEGPPSGLQALNADMSEACSSARWDSVQVGQADASPHTASQLEPQVVAGQGAETSTDSYCGRVHAQMLQAVLLTWSCALRRGDNPHAAVEKWRLDRGVNAAALGVFWREGKLTPKGMVLRACWRLGEAEWLKRGKALLKLCADVDQAKKNKDKPFSLRNWGVQHGIPPGSQQRYAKRGKVTVFARTWAEEVREFVRIQEAVKFGERQNPALEALPAPAAEISSVDSGHLATASLAPFPELSPQESDSAWGDLSDVDLVRLGPQFPSFDETFGKSANI